MERFEARKHPEGTPPQGANERQLRKAWDAAHAERYASGREVSPEKIEAAEERLQNVMGRCQELWDQTIDEKGTTFTEKKIAIGSAYQNVKDMLVGAGIVLVPLAALAPQLSDDKYVTAMDSVAAGGATGALFLTALALAKMAEKIRSTALSVSTKEKII